MLTLSLESNDREPGTIYRSLICKENPPNNRSHPTTGNDSTRERLMSAPALDLIVPTRSVVPSREPGSRERFVTVVTVTAYCYGRRTNQAPGEMGPSWRYSNTGGASAVSRHRQAAKPGYHSKLPVTTRRRCQSRPPVQTANPCKPCFGFAR